MFTNIMYTEPNYQHIQTLVHRVNHLEHTLNRYGYLMSRVDIYHIKLEREIALQTIEQFHSALNIQNTFSPSRFVVYTPSRFS